VDSAYDAVVDLDGNSVVVFTIRVRMHTTAEYRRHAEECRKLAARLTVQSDKLALTLMAVAWERAAKERERKRDEQK
jgi:hypothetical protein